MAVVTNLETYAPGCRVEIEGEALPPTAVLNVAVDENLEAPTKFDMTFNEGLDIKTQKFTWLDDPRLNPGNKVDIYFGYAGKKSKSLFKGTIKALSPSFASTGIPSLTVEGYDLSHAMQKKMTKINDREVKHSDIARELAKEYLLKPDGIEDSEKKYKKVERRKGEKDYQFLRRLAKKSGFECFVQGGTLYFRKPKDVKSQKKIVKAFQYRKNFISFSPRLTMANLVSEVVVSGWNKDTKEPIKVSVTLKDIGTSSDIGSSLKKFIQASEGSEPQIIEHKPLSSEEEARHIAEVELKKAINNFIHGNVECIGDVKLRPGNKVSITGLGELFSGDYYIQSAKHTFGDSGYRTTLGVRRIVLETKGGVSESQEGGLLQKEKEDETQTGQVSGVVIGIITDNKDQEKLGRVKVSFPWRGKTDQSTWARVATLMAGKDRGTFFLPEVGDEVLVAFDRGEMRHPYVIGALWNGKDKPPETNSDGKNNIRKIRSRSGHEIIFNDDNEAKQEKIEIHTNAGHKVVLDDSAGQEKIEIVDKTGSNKISIDSVQNSLSIESAMQLKIKANVVEIEGTGSLTLKSNAVLTIQGLPVKIN